MTHEEIRERVANYYNAEKNQLRENFYIGGSLLCILLETA